MGRRLNSSRQPSKHRWPVRLSSGQSSHAPIWPSLWQYARLFVWSRVSFKRWNANRSEKPENLSTHRKRWEGREKDSPHVILFLACCFHASLLRLSYKNGGGGTRTQGHQDTRWLAKCLSLFLLTVDNLASQELVSVKRRKNNFSSPLFKVFPSPSHHSHLRLPREHGLKD